MDRLSCVGALFLVLPMAGWLTYWAALSLIGVWHQSILAAVSLILMLCGAVLLLVGGSNASRKEGP